MTHYILAGDIGGTNSRLSLHAGALCASLCVAFGVTYTSSPPVPSESFGHGEADIVRRHRTVHTCNYKNEGFSSFNLVLTQVWRGLAWQ